MILFLTLALSAAFFVTGFANGPFRGAGSIVQNFTNPGGTKENKLVKTNSGVTEPVVFIHISDTHFGQDRGKGDDFKKAFFNNVVRKINPLAVVHTGDLVDKGYRSDYWDSYNSIVAKTQTYPKYIDILGNHDVKKNILYNGLNGFTANSVTGRSGGNFYGTTYIGSTIPVCLIRTNTAAADTSDSDYNRQNIDGCFSKVQADYITEKLKSSPAAAFNVLLAHHPITGKYAVKKGSIYMKNLIDSAKAPIYLCGHVHQPSLTWLDNPPINTLIVAGDAFGRNGFRSSFYLVAYDMFTGP
ncbi:MAG TPA: metallophosphoesterase, partial [Candidatus Wallbacteria bacterium]|nr:metallophosphoesterase [Candidatus Wallbacteria bacterium]